MLFSAASYKLTTLEKKQNAQYTFLYMKPNGNQLSIIANIIESGGITPVIDKVFSFEDTQKAMEYSEVGRAKGKIIVKIK